jgi:CheY-like chemotaxis protein
MPWPFGRDKPPPLPAPAPATILVADDEPYIVRLIEVSLQRASYRVVTTTVADKVLPLIQSERPALIVLESHMPDYRPTGCEILRALRSDPTLAETPVILLGHKGEHAGGDCCQRHLSAGEDATRTDYLLKPFNPMELLTLVRRALDEEGPARVTEIFKI